MPIDSKQIVDEVLSQYEASRKWWAENYFSEFSEVYRNLHCRTVPLLDKDGKEITGRTNVALPDHAVMRRKKTARLTANPPNLRVRGGINQEQRDKVSALNYRQWDLSREQQVFRSVVDQCVVFGWSVRKGWWNKIVSTRRLRRSTDRLDRSQIMLALGAPPDEIEQAVTELGKQLSEVEMMEAIAKLGDEVSLPMPTVKYEGPVGERIFIGDIFPEPGFRSLNSSAWVTEHTEWDMSRIKYMAAQKTVDPSGEERTVFDPARVEELLSIEGAGRDHRKAQELRQQLREAIKQSDPQIGFDNKLRGPRWEIMERHSIDQESGRIVIDWIGAQKVHLGRQWYPWDTQGRYLYTELVLIPDILGGVGDSTIRLSRFLMQMRNARMNQTTDFINKKLRPVFKRVDTADIPDEAYERTGWSEIVVKHPDDLSLLIDPQFPPEGFSDQAQLVREMQQVEPLMNDFQPGTETIPQAGRLATTAIFQQRSADQVTADELRQVDFYLADVLNLNMYMTQQAMSEPLEVDRGVMEQIDSLSLFKDGEARAIKIDPLEIQEDLEIIPETGSTLAADDDFKKQSIQQGFAIAAAHPDVFNKRAFAAKVVETIPGMKIEDALAPEQEGPQPPEVKVSLSIAYKDLAPDVKVEFLRLLGMPTQGTEAESALDMPRKVNEAALNAAQLEQPAPEPQPEPEVGKDGRVRVKKQGDKK